jgi:hypothetical protein
MRWIALLLLAGCGPSSWLGDERILVPGDGVGESDCRTKICKHNENTDLVNWGGATYLVHRTARSQVLGPNSSLHLYKTVDGGKNFKDLATIQAPTAATYPMLGDRDLRDPEFYVVGQRLYIKALTRLPVTSTRDSFVDTIAVETHTDDGATWSPLAPIGPVTWSYWRIKPQAGVYYTAAYEDGDKSIVLFSSTDGLSWTKGALVYGVAADTPVETELTFMPSGRLLALVRMDGTDDELLGEKGRLRTKVCWAMPPYATFDCPAEITGQRLDGPLSFFHGSKLYMVARKHLGADGRKRTALFEITGNLEGGPIDAKEIGELPSAGDTAYAGAADLDANRTLVTWYSSNIQDDENWVLGILDASDIRVGIIDFSKL